MNTPYNQREGFSTSIGVIAAAAGSAVGLGNVWKFPYLAGIHGGASFILLYLLCVILICTPIMLSEFVIGRRAEKSAVGAFKLLKPKTPWFLTGYLGLLSAFIILSFYSVVAGWTIAYFVKTVMQVFLGLDAAGVSSVFSKLVSGTVEPIAYHAIFMFFTGFVVYSGVKDGIERYSKILMPLLFVLLIILDMRAITLNNSFGGIEFLFKPDFMKLLEPSALLDALGQAFFSLSIGLGTMITYGSYISKDQNLGTTAVTVALTDTIVAILAGLAVFPAAFAFGIEPTAGPALVFISLPNVFNQMPMGQLFGALFFLLLFIAALTSSISILEVLVAYLNEEKKVDRQNATVIMAFAAFVFGAFLSLSNGMLSSIQVPFLFLQKSNLFDWFVALTDLLLPIGGLFIAIFVGWFMKKDDVEMECLSEGKVPAGYFGVYWFLIKYIVPLVIIAIVLSASGFINKILGV